MTTSATSLASTTSVWNRRQLVIALLAIVAIAAHLLLRYAMTFPPHVHEWPLKAALVLGGIPLILELLVQATQREFGADWLAGIAIVTSVILGEYLAGTLVVLMLSGGEALEAYAVASASSVLAALARRMPSVAHRKTADGNLVDIALDEIQVGDTLLVFPHETCPVDGTVLDGHGAMDESYLTGEPYVMSKTPGSDVLSGAINGEAALTIKAEKLAVDSRYAKIMEVMRQSEQQRPRLRRLGDQLGAVYTPFAVSLALLAWWGSGEAIRFLAVLVVATPCPLLIAIPVAIIGSISLSARRGIIVRNPAVLEQLDTCRTIIFDKTGTLTYGRPKLTDQFVTEPWDPERVLQLTASLERYSKHPLAAAILEAAETAGIALLPADEISEKPGTGLQGTVAGHRIEVTSRKKLSVAHPEESAALPQQAGGLECVLRIDDRYAATYRFRDEPRLEGRSFIRHLEPSHNYDRVMLVSGDRESEVRYLAERVGIKHVFASQSPEQKLKLVREETSRARTVFLGDGINDAPALAAATVGIAFGQNSDVTTEAADAVVLDSSLTKVDEFLHIGSRMRRIAMQSAIGGMALSVVGMFVAAFGYLPPVAGAVAQEAIDVLAVFNALRMAFPPRELSDLALVAPTGRHPELPA